MLLKLKAYGVNELSCKWFRSYLTGRSHCTCLNSALSEISHVTCGVPQGSILGPLLFILYINDLPNCIQSCRVAMYADDTIIYFAHRSLETIKQAIQCDSTLLVQWFTANKLSLNPTKCKAMLVGTQRSKAAYSNLHLTLAGSNLDQVHTFKYLGVVLDSALQWNDHISHVTKKLSQVIGIMKCLKPFINKQALLTIYSSLFLPHLQYCSTVWDQGSKVYMDKLQKLQNRAGRVILGCDLYTPSETIMHTLGWTPVVDILKRNKAVLVFKALNGMSPPHISGLFTELRGVHSHNTRLRAQGGLQLPKAHLQYKKKSLSCSGAVLWNSLPARVKAAASVESFKHMYKKECLTT